MVLKVIDATQAKTGTIILLENEPYNVRSNDISKSGKHGAAKCRIEALGVFTDKKKIVAVPGSERFDVPNVEKHKGQILNVGESTASVMDLDSFETIDIAFMPGIKDELATEKQVEYYDIEGVKKIMRVL
jgi:translation initiation factor 5A